MKTFIPTKTRNPCQVCGDTDGKCRETEELLLCMNESTEVRGFRFLGLTKDDLWGMYLPGDLEEHSEVWRDRQKERLEQEQRRRSLAMTAVDRDRYYGSILAQLSLNSEDYQDLKRRGLSDEAIEMAGFRTVDYRQKLRGLFPENLPGINQDQTSLNTQSGYLCPVRDVSDRLVGCQIRLRDSDSGRYRWLSSVTQSNPDGASPHLPNGEMPIAVYKASEASDWIGLTEGTGPKPLLTSIRFNQVVIGASGGQFPASRQTLLDSLKALNAKGVIFYPDAGSIVNLNVLRQYRATLLLLKEYGFSLQVAWWGQDHKSCPDVDELGDESIDYLPPHEFFNLAKKRAIDECRILYRMLGISADGPLTAQDLARAGLKSRIEQMNAVELLTLQNQLKARWDILLLRGKLSSVLKRLKLTWTSSPIKEALNGRSVEELNDRELKELLEGLERGRLAA